MNVHDRNLSMMNERMFQYPLVSSVEQDLQQNQQAMAAFVERQTSPMTNPTESSGAGCIDILQCGTVALSTPVTTQMQPQLVSASISTMSVASALLQGNDVAESLGVASRDNCSIETYANSVYFPVQIHRMIEEVGLADSSLAHWHSNNVHFWIGSKHNAFLQLLQVYFKRKCNRFAKQCVLSSLFHSLTLSTTCRQLQTKSTNRSDDFSTCTSSLKVIVGRK
jgi:hypothetical protein